MLKCDLITFQSAGRERILLPDVQSVAAALQIGISAASCSICDGICQFKTCTLQQGLILLQPKIKITSKTVSTPSLWI